ncbi:MAG: pyruvate formate lyase family protein [Atribacterota bacterium]|nr:pyruvate formate lyase family protein [Atribacterota bacterium]
MKKLMKYFLRHTYLYPTFREYRILYYKYNEIKSKNIIKRIVNALNLFFKVKLVFSFNKGDYKRAILFKNFCKNARIRYLLGETFLYDIDFFLLPLFSLNGDNVRPIGNLTINYDRLIKFGINDIQKEIKEKMQEKHLNSSQISFLKGLIEVCEGIDIFHKRCLLHLKKQYKKHPSNRKIKDLIKIFSRIPMYPARDLKEAMQFYLFINSLLWMDKHPLIGLGRLDQILYAFFKKDLNEGKITKKEAYFLISGFLEALHKGYKFKSNTLLGDTGQVIILGGMNEDGSDSSNDFTCMIMDILKELNLPDPKIVLRVHSKTSKKVWKKAFNCLSSGLQYPLFSNDEVIIPSLMKFGYFKKDAYDYGTSACWEPIIIGKSLDQNNLWNINFLEPLHKLIEKIVKENIEITNFEKFLQVYKKELRKHIKEGIKKLNELNFETSELLSLFIDDCFKLLKNISEGGARYNNYGILSIGLSNVVNSIINVEKIIFIEKKYSLEQVWKIIENNFSNNKSLLEDLRSNCDKFCMDNEKIIFLTSELVDTAYQTIKTFKNRLGGKFKFGLSSPAYISSSKNFPASLDGRRYGMPFGVNISPLPFGPSLSYSEIANFASKIDYKKAFNGGVLDMMLEKIFLENNKDNIINFLKAFFEIGGMQCQLNILDYSCLAKAKRNPEMFSNLIVRVWGFCAYFKDLPEEYQNLILERAKYYESISGRYSKV